MKAFIIAIVVVVIAGVGTGIGFTIRNQYIKIQNAKPDYSSTSLVVQDMAGILTEETESVSEGGDETEAQGSEADQTTEAAQETETSGETEAAQETETSGETEAAQETTAVGESETGN